MSISKYFTYTVLLFINRARKIMHKNPTEKALKKGKHLVENYFLYRKVIY